MIKILVVDDSVVFRKVMTEALKKIPDIEVVGSAVNGKLALEKINQLQPQLITLDLEMPEMDGLAVLDALRTIPNPPTVIVISALTSLGSKLTMQALQKGAFDFITKPDSNNIEEGIQTISSELAPRIKVLQLRLGVRSILQNRDNIQNKDIKSTTNEVKPKIFPQTRYSKPELVLIGVSTGGPNALAAMLPLLPKDLGVPILIVQHMPPVFTQTLAEHLNNICSLKVCEATNGQVIVANNIYIAPGGHHMRMINFEGQRILQITDDPPENNCRPAVDYLFRSVSQHLPGKAMAVILTGMGSDGTIGMQLLKQNGCYTIAQDEATCVVNGMPKAAIKAGVIDIILPLLSIPDQIVKVVKGIVK